MNPEAEAAYEALYDGNKSRVRDVGDALLKAVESLGKGVRITVTEQYVAMATDKREFGVFFPASGRRVTLRLQLGGRASGTSRIESTAHQNPNGRFDARAYLAHTDHVDEDLMIALRRARDLAK